MKHYLLILSMTFSSVCYGQYSDSIIVTQGPTGFMYSEGIRWYENKKQDSVLDIIIEGDTMTAIRNLLVYCLQEKSEGDNARILLSMINLDELNKLFKNRDFNFYLKEYRKVVAKNKKEQAVLYKKITNNNQ